MNSHLLLSQYTIKISAHRFQIGTTNISRGVAKWCIKLHQNPFFDGFVRYEGSNLFPSFARFCGSSELTPTKNIK